jgi:arylsulfatase A-like enzyme
MPFRRICAGLSALPLVLALAACTTGSTQVSAAPRRSAGPSAAGPAGAVRPNIVFVLTDDLSGNLVRYMPNVLALQKEGTSFSNYSVTDSLCCPSRASIFTGRFPHNTGIFKNHGADGGFRLFHSRGEEASTFATDLKAAGYRTAFLGKYLNEYSPSAKLGGALPYVPPGWDEWDAGGNAYTGFDYSLNENHQIRRYGSAPRDYLTDVLAAKARTFVTASATGSTPFFVEVATYAPHSPYTPAPRDAAAFPGLKAPRGAAFDALPAQAPAWLAGHARLTAQKKARIDEVFRKRVQAVQAVDRMLGDLRDTLRRAGVADRTLVVFSSDNGYHLGEHRLSEGKQTAFDTDITVPLVVAGPGVRPARVVPSVVENVDLRPTFAELAGAPAPAEADGHSFAALLTADAPPGWRDLALVEHRDPAADPADPDFENDAGDIPPSYDAIRAATYTYVEYADGSREYYDRRTDPDELRNTVSTLPAPRLAAMHDALQSLKKCRGLAPCWTAAHAPA